MPRKSKRSVTYLVMYKQNALAGSIPFRRLKPAIVYLLKLITGGADEVTFSRVD